MPLPSFHVRTDEDELMDDFSIIDERLTDALDQLRNVNRWLGGYGTTMGVLGPWLRSRAQSPSQAQPLRILDLGTGIADFPEYIVRWAAQHVPAIALRITAIDANPITVDYARRALRERLPAPLGSQIQLELADALHLPYETGSFDIAIGSMFLHHFAQERAVHIVKEMQRIAQGKILINDLHRHPLAYYGIYSLTRLFNASPMMKHDGPLSVLRGFTADELQAIATQAGLVNATVTWRYPFRWVLTTLQNPV